MRKSYQRYFRYYLAVLLALGTRLAPAAALPGAPAAGAPLARGPKATENFGAASK